MGKRIAVFAHVHDPGVEHALLAILGIRLFGHQRKLATRQRQRRVRAAGKGRRPVDVRQQFGMRRIADVVDGESAVAPRAITAIAGDDHVVQRDAFAFGRGVRLFRGAVHSGQPGLSRPAAAS